MANTQINDFDSELRVSNIAAAKREPVYKVDINDPLSKATTLMRLHDFSQLPVMSGTHKTPKGVITWESIGKALLRDNSASLADCTNLNYEKVGLSDNLYEVVKLINRDGFVVVLSDTDGSPARVSGIITSADIGDALIYMTQPYLLLRRCELKTRYLTQKFLTRLDNQAFSEILTKVGISLENKTSLEDLTFGELHKVISVESIWPNFPIEINRKVFNNHINEIVKLRNEVMHFRKLDRSSETILNSIGNFLNLVDELEKQLDRMHV